VTLDAASAPARRAVRQEARRLRENQGEPQAPKRGPPPFPGAQGEEFRTASPLRRAGKTPVGREARGGDPRRRARWRAGEFLAGGGPRGARRARTQRAARAHDEGRRGSPAGR